MKREESICYEKPQLETYRFTVKVAAGESPSDIDEGCDSDFDD